LLASLFFFAQNLVRDFCALKVFCELVQVKTIEADSIGADLDLGEVRPRIFVEHVTAHAQVGRCVAVSNDARKDVHFFRTAHFLASVNICVMVARSCLFDHDLPRLMR
jgi:hypothetical protein